MAGLITTKRGKFWQYAFETAPVNGKRKRITKSGFKTKAMALEAGTIAFAEYNNCGVSFIPSEMSYNDYLDFWIKEYCEINLKYETVNNYKKRIRLHIKPALGIYKISSITTQSIQKLINELAKKGYSRNTLSTVKGIISVSLDYAYQQKMIRENPALYAKLPAPRSESIKLREEPNVYLSAEKIEKIFKRFPEGHPAHLPLMIAYRCGTRLGETYALTWDCVDLENKTITINKQIQWNANKGLWYFSAPKYNSYRTISLDNELAALLMREKTKQQRAKEYYDEYYAKYFVDDTNHLNTETGREIDLVLVRENGTYTQARTMTHAARMIHYELGIMDFTFHSLRHTHATMLAENDVPIKYVSERLGHKDSATTMRIYQHVTQKMVEDSNDIIERMYTKST